MISCFLSEALAVTSVQIEAGVWIMELPRFRVQRMQDIHADYSEEVHVHVRIRKAEGVRFGNQELLGKLIMMSIAWRMTIRVFARRQPTSLASIKAQLPRTKYSLPSTCSPVSTV